MGSLFDFAAKVVIYYYIGVNDLFHKIEQMSYCMKIGTDFLFTMVICFADIWWFEEKLLILQMITYHELF